MKKTDLTSLYERLYFHELDRRDKISARQATPLGAVVGLVAITAFLLNSRPVFSSQIVSSIFWLLLIASIVCLLIGAWHFRCSWLRHNERHVATAAEIDEYFVQLEKHYSGQPNAAALVERDFSQFLLDTYRRSATTNAQNNDARSESLHSAGTWLTIGACLSLASTVPYYLGRGFTNVGQEAHSASTSSVTAAGTSREGR